MSVQPADARDEPKDSGSRPLDPRVRTLWRLVGALLVAQLLLPAVVLDLLGVVTPRGMLTALVALAGGVLAWVLPEVRYRRWRYALREHDLWIRQGIFWVTISVIPYARLQFVDTRQGPLDRMFGLSQLVVHTAAVGTSGRLPGLDTAEAEHLRETLAEVRHGDPTL